MSRSIFGREEILDFKIFGRVDTSGSGLNGESRFALPQRTAQSILAIKRRLVFNHCISALQLEYSVILHSSTSGRDHSSCLVFPFLCLRGCHHLVQLAGCPQLVVAPSGGPGANVSGVVPYCTTCWQWPRYLLSSILPCPQLVSYQIFRIVKI